MLLAFVFKLLTKVKLHYMGNGMVRYLMDMAESMLLTLLAIICQSSFSRIKVSQWILKG